jgi:hypothetical protein
MNTLDITLFESIKNLEPSFIVTDVFEHGIDRHRKAIYLDKIHNWAVLDISTPTHKNKYTIVDIDTLNELTAFSWKYTPYVNKKTGKKNEYVQTVVTEAGKQICTTINRVILFGFGNKSKMVADHTRQNKLDNRRQSLQMVTHQENLQRADRRPWEGGAKVASVAIETPDGTFESQSAAARFYEVTSQCICQRLKNCAKGYKRVQT